MIRVISQRKSSVVGYAWIGFLLLPFVHAVAVGTVRWLFSPASTTLPDEIYRFYRDSGSYLAGPGWVLGGLTGSLRVNWQARHVALVRWGFTMSAATAFLIAGVTFYQLWDVTVVRKNPVLLMLCAFVFANVTLQWALGLAIMSKIAENRLKMQAPCPTRI